MIRQSFIQGIRDLRAQHKAGRKPANPCDQPQQYRVRLNPVASAADQRALWDAPQQWCRQEVNRTAGGRWCRRMDRLTDQPSSRSRTSPQPPPSG